MARRLIWVGSSQKDLSAFPEQVKDDILLKIAAERHAETIAREKKGPLR